MRTTLTENDSGGTRDVRLGDEIIVILGENPTTGYRWQTDIDPARLELCNDTYAGPDQPVGAGGTRQLTFEARRTGPTELHLVKRRSWEPNVVAEFRVTLDIADA